jgi:hypothetical protein
MLKKIAGRQKQLNQYYEFTFGNKKRWPYKTSDLLKEVQLLKKHADIKFGAQYCTRHVSGITFIRYGESRKVEKVASG